MLQPNTALFEACCNEKIQQFDDSGSDEEVSVFLDSSNILILKNTIEGQAGVVGTYGVKHLHLFTL